MTTHRVFPDPFPPACATAWGDDRYGLWCEITVKGVVQRLRWIEPGAFWMGSTDDERKRFAAGDKDWLNLVSDEAPRHRVRLTQGFWLADTACTQALWQAVVGDSPSNFEGESDLPVEQVSWDDVTKKFLSALNGVLAEAEVFLPTEAQWEYACRAGTKTAYHFGETITTDQVNFDGNHPPPGGQAGVYRQKTLPVKALLANSWGLYQMHGNVWEWCSDARRSYAEESVADPDGGQGGSVRALRGGSWLLGAGWSRGASRHGYHRVTRSGRFGFRFALRSVEPGRQEAGGPRADGVR
jgi:formylglycine-generating enzyme required for sulfatase activity